MIVFGTQDVPLWKTLLPAAFSLFGAIGVAVGVYLSGRRQAKIDLTLELHKQYYSDESGRARSKARKFLCRYWDVDWAVYDPYDLEDPKRQRAGYAHVIRFLHRLAVLRLHYPSRVNPELVVELFSRELGWWFGLGLERMERRQEWWTGPKIVALRDLMIRQGGLREYREGFAAGRRNRLRNRRLTRLDLPPPRPAPTATTS